ncbi:MAG: tetratricopeptide repeat protein [Anaerolineae bacterium]
MAAPRLVSGSYEDLYTKAQLHLGRGEVEEAQEILERLHLRLGKMGERIFARRPELEGLYFISTAQLALALRRQEKYEEALHYYQMLLNLAPENSMLYEISIGSTRIELGQVEAGLDELRAVTMMHPGEPLAWLSLGVELMDAGESEEAERNLKRALDCDDPDEEYHFKAYSHLFGLYQRQGRYDEAEMAWENIERLTDPEVRTVYPLYQMYWEAGDLEKTRSWLSKEKNPLRKALYQGLLAQANGDTNRAKSLWKKAAERDPLDFDEGYEAWAEANLRTIGDAKKVIGVLNIILEYEEPDIQTLVLLASAEAHIGHGHHAKDALVAATELLKNYRPRRRHLEAKYWALLDELVPDETIKEQLKPYFEHSPA